MGDARRESRRLFIQRSAAVVGAGLLLRGCEVPPSRRLASTGEPAAGAGASASSPVAAAPPKPFMPDLTPPTSEPQVRVRLARSSAGDRGLQVASAGRGRWLRVAPVNADDTLGFERVAASPIVATAEPGGWTVVDGQGMRLSFDGDAIDIAAAGGQPAGVSFDGTPFPGSIRLVSCSSEGAFVVDVVNGVPLEAYLPGVLARELYAKWHPETYAAQAVAARSFACSEVAFWRGRRHYDVVAGQASQAYAGRTTSTVALQAVEATRGTLLLWQGKVVPAYYSSCCGGVSASAVDAISPHPMNDIPPIQARPPRDCCASAPVWRWTSEQGDKDAANRLVAWSASRDDVTIPRLGPVVAVETIAVATNGRPLRYRVVDDRGGTVEVAAEQLRWGLNYSAAGVTPPRQPVRSANFSASRAPGTLRLAGRGYGHGVGLCQYGAQASASAGVAWRTILQGYYPGAAIDRCFA
ncbi:MAG: SpoIID/LytB domain-containing protein [Phycisphaerales bacterium]|nr:SpoIID/LytB domain-containing protein [Phycisphaerales bacterium]